VVSFDLNTYVQAVVLNQSGISYCHTDPDPANHMIGCKVGSQFNIYDTSDFSLIKSLEAGTGQFYLLNNTVLCTTGAQINISDIP